MNVWMDLRSFFHIQKAGSLRAMDLVSADTHKVDLPFCRLYLHLSIGLDGIYMKHNLWIKIFYHFSKFLNIQNGSDLIIYHHD